MENLSITSGEYRQAIAWLIFWGHTNEDSAPFAMVCNVFDRTPEMVSADIEIGMRQRAHADRFPVSCVDY